jgi:hypothetical protein
LTEDTLVNADDIDRLFGALLFPNPDNDAIYDLDQNGTVDSADVDELLFNILHTNYGDANLDGVVDGSDFNIWNDNKFQTQVGWAGGNFNGDLVVDGSDFNIWLQNRFTPIVAAELPVAVDVDLESEPRDSPPRAALSSQSTPASMHQQQVAVMSANIVSVPSEERYSAESQRTHSSHSDSVPDDTSSRPTTRRGLSSTRLDNGAISPMSDTDEITPLDRFFSGLRTSRPS